MIMLLDGQFGFTPIQMVDLLQMIFDVVHFCAPMMNRAITMFTITITVGLEILTILGPRKPLMVLE